MLGTFDKKPFFAQGLRFSCIRCSACCRFESGFVYLSEKDTSLLAVALKINKMEFTEFYCRWIPSENGDIQLSLKEKPNYDCVFWVQDKGCSVYEARPLQCRAFPFWLSVLNDRNSWKSTARACPGMDKGTLHQEDSIREWLDMRQKEPIISRNGMSKGES